MIPKNAYQQRIAEYRKRREALKNEYQQRIRRMSYKIKIWARQVRRIEQRQERIHKLALKAQEFTRQKLKKSYPGQNRELTAARKLFFKYALEHGIRAVDLAVYVGCKRSETPSCLRRAFNKELEHSKESRQLWMRFKIFMKDEI